ncbi:MAG: HAMP domain-containing protein [Verrucomicrobiota bacterium]|nr:HAMP domain-containing protein [Verrucomicrobiota bacterium]
MKKKHLFWLLLPTYWVLTAIAIVVVAFYAFHSMSSLYFQTLENDIHTRATLLSEQVFPFVSTSDGPAIDALCKKLGESAGTRFTVIMPDGKVMGDTDESPDIMEYHGDRPEIRRALGGDAGMDRRYSRTVKQEMMYIAVPLKDYNHITLCAVRASLPMTAIKGELNQMASRVVVAALLTGLLSMVVCILVVRRITAPLRGMGNAALQFAEGDFGHRIPAQQTIELDQLAESLNTMSEQLNKTLSTVSEQRNEQQVVLSSMDEAVLAIDKRERIIHMNRVAGEILGVNHKERKRELIQQVVRFSNLQEFIKTVLSSQKPLSRDLTWICFSVSPIKVRSRESAFWDPRTALMNSCRLANRTACWINSRLLSLWFTPRISPATRFMWMIRSRRSMASTPSSMLESTACCSLRCSLTVERVLSSRSDIVLSDSANWSSSMVCCAGMRWPKSPSANCRAALPMPRSGAVMRRTTRMQTTIESRPVNRAATTTRMAIWLSSPLIAVIGNEARTAHSVMWL